MAMHGDIVNNLSQGFVVELNKHIYSFWLRGIKEKSLRVQKKENLGTLVIKRKLWICLKVAGLKKLLRLLSVCF